MVRPVASDKEKKRSCVMCAIETLRNMAANKDISTEQYAEQYERIEWHIRQSAHRIRLVCSKECYVELQEMMKAARIEQKNKDAARAREGNLNTSTNNISTVVDSEIASIIAATKKKYGT